MGYSNGTGSILVSLPHFDEASAAIDDGDIIVVEKGWHHLVSTAAARRCWYDEVLASNVAVSFQSESR
jgi:hypothetical protein